MVTYDFSGKVALITGAAGGIGRATAEAFASSGASVAVSDIDLPGAEETVEIIKSRGGSAAAIHADVSDSASVKEMVERAVATFGGLDFAHNNAGIVGAGKPIEAMDDDIWERGIAVMLSGVFYGMKHEIPAIKARGGGAIVNTSSGAGLIGFPEMANYVAAKHGVIGLTKVAALECIGANIRVNSICPGTARSRMVDEWIGGDAAQEKFVADLHPIGRIADPSEIAAAVLWLCSDAASFVMGIAMPVDGGYTIP
jgi:NAD(P)-dependent dehydrogenase (short-subunit alcohol dehydrogenase family)